MNKKMFSISLIILLLLTGCASIANAAQSGSPVSVAVATSTPFTPSNNIGAGQGQDCRADLSKVASALNVTTEQLQSALGDPTQGRPDLTAVASKLGVTTDAIRQAMQQARPSNCPTPNGGQQNGQGQREACRPDLTKVASSLNVTTEQLQSALGDSTQGRPDLTAAASKLGITVDALQQAMQQARPSNCQPPNGSQFNGRGQREACRADLTKVATTLNITIEQLQSALGDPTQGWPDLTAVASKLGITVDALQQAMQQARPSNCPTPNGGQPKP